MSLCTKLIDSFDHHTDYPSS